jgi:uncharacterized membrane protein
VSLLDALFEFLFKYPLRTFERGTLVWQGLGVSVAAALVLAGGTIALLSYRRPARARRRDRAVLLALRLTALLLIGLCLLRPSLRLSRSVPQQNAIAVLLDDSRSMQIRDVGQRTRLEAVLALAGDSSAGSLVRRLGERFAVRTYRFSETVQRLGRTVELSGQGARTDLAAALDEARRDAAGAPLAGIVVISDGADNGGTPLTEPLLSLQAAQIPVYTVGLGAERFPRDLAVERIELPRSTLRGAVLLGSVALRARGLAGETISLTVEDGGRIVAQQSVAVPRATEVVTVPVRIPPLEPGPRELTVTAKPLAGELVSQDNTVHAVVRVRDRREKILYVEGVLRPEFAFLRRAAGADSNLQLVGLMRSAEGKFLRLGVDDSLELFGGFPTTRAELFRYRGLILGSIEASFFTPDQLRMIADFVGERGGGLLALGGRASYGEGAYEGTPVAEALPVTFTNRRADSAEPAVELDLSLTPAGAASAALLLTAEASDNARRWDSLPPLTSVNRWLGLKAGAVALATGVPEGEGGAEPALAYHRYGRGKAIALQVQDTWLWQMHTAIPLEDQTHETLWRQMLRWLLEDVPDRLEVAVAPDHPGPGQRVTVQAEVGDSAFLRVNDARAVARLTTPLGAVDTLPLDWALGRDGTYTAGFVPREEGVYRLEVEAQRGADTLRAEPQFVMVADRGLDFLNAEMRAPLLRRIATETGGRFYTPERAARIPDDAQYTEAGVTVTEVKDLWDMPIVFFVLVSLLGTEWVLRRRRGMA